jgi:hypothetical protein
MGGVVVEVIGGMVAGVVVTGDVVGGGVCGNDAEDFGAQLFIAKTIPPPITMISTTAKLPLSQGFLLVLISGS